MNHKKLIAILVGLTCVPFIANAQSTSTVATSTATSTQTVVQSSTLCTQNAIRKRDAALVTARNLYNASMTVALEARTLAEISAIAVGDEDSQNDALKSAATVYGAQVKQAQEILKSTRQDVLSVYDEEIRKCRTDKRFNQNTGSGNSKKLSEDIQQKSGVAHEVIQSEKDQQKTTLRILQNEYKKKVNDIKSFFRGEKENDNSSRGDN